VSFEKEERKESEEVKEAEMTNKQVRER